MVVRKRVYLDIKTRSTQHGVETLRVGNAGHSMHRRALEGFQAPPVRPIAEPAGAGGYQLHGVGAVCGPPCGDDGVNLLQAR